MTNAVQPCVASLAESDGSGSSPRIPHAGVTGSQTSISIERITSPRDDPQELTLAGHGRALEYFLRLESCSVMKINPERLVRLRSLVFDWHQS